MSRKRGTVLTGGQMKELVAAVVEGIPADLAGDVAQSWIGRKGELAAGLRQLLMPPAKSKAVGQPAAAETPLAKWARFYVEVFGREVDTSALAMPLARGDINVPLVMADGLTAQALFETCRKRFGAWKLCEGDLKCTSDRDPRKGAYIVLVRYRVEADEEHKSKSAQVIKASGITGITLEERLLLELFYHWDTGGGHLDTRTWTLCSGSRFAGGNVPHVGWGDGSDELRVSCYDPGHYVGYLRVREVVSGPTDRAA